MRFIQAMLGAAAVVCMAALPVHAGQHGNGKAGATHGPTAKAPAPKATTSTTTTQHGNPHVTTTPTSTTTSTTATTKTSKKTPTSTTTTTTTTTTTVSPLVAKIASHPQLAAKVKALLPEGMMLKDAAMGFTSQGRFISALHVSRNLNISFKQLQLEITGPDHLSLGQAIQKLRPNTTTTTATTEVHRAETEADEDLKVATAPVSSKKKHSGGSK